MNLMITILEPSVEFLGTVGPCFRDFARLQDSSSVGLIQVETFLHMFSALLSDYFTHDHRKLKLLGRSAKSNSDGANGNHCVGQTECFSTASVKHVDSKLAVALENLSNISEDWSAIKCLVAFAYIWGFGSSLLDRYWMMIVISSTPTKSAKIFVLNL